MILLQMEKLSLRSVGGRDSFLYFAGRLYRKDDCFHLRVLINGLASDFINRKCWYYETAIAAGTEKIHFQKRIQRKSLAVKHKEVDAPGEKPDASAFL